MTKKSEMNSMRRRVIADSAPQKKAESQADAQINTLEDIGRRLDDQQASTDLISDVIETKSNEIIKSVEDVSAGVELTAEASERTTDAVSKLNDTASLINDKLTKLADLLSKKHDVQQDVQKTGTGTSLETITEQVPDAPVQQPLEELLERLIPPQDDRRPDADFFPSTEEQEEKAEPKKETEDKNKKFLDLKFGELIKSVKSGFGKTISLTDKISSMLFSYTVSALAQMAKTAAMVLGVIMLIDLIKVHFNYWTKLFEKNFVEFNKQAKEWGPLLTAISEMSNEIVKSFVKGDWGGLAKAIGSGLVDVIDKLGETIMLGMSKLLAGMLRALGFNDSADNIEGAALDRFQTVTGAELDEEDAKMRAKYVDRQEREYDEKPEWKRKLSAKFQKFTGQIDDDEYNKLLSGEKKQSAYADLPEDERLKIITARNNAEAELKRTKAYVEKTDASDSTRLDSAKDAVQSTTTRYKELEKLSPEVAKDLKVELDQLQKLLDSKISEPAPTAEAIPAAEQPEVKQSASIKAAADSREAARIREYNTQPQPIQVNTAVNKNSTYVYRTPPQTSTAAPGMQGAMKTS